MKTYSTPEAFKKALDDRLRARAKAAGADFERERQILIFDRLVARMTSTFGARVVVKGGFALELRLETARTTRDVDFRMVGSSDDIQEAGRLDLGDRLRFEIARAKHAEIAGAVYHGQRFTTHATLAGRRYGNAFGMDVGFGDVLTEEPDIIIGDDALLFVGVAAPTHRVYPRGAHLAEKVHAYTRPGDRPNTRVKDLPDIALLATTGELDAATLIKAIDATFAQRATHPVPESLPAPAAEWAAVYREMALASSLPWPDLESVTRAASAFVDPILARTATSWSPAACRWS